LCRTYGARSYLCEFSHRFRGGLTYAAPTALVCRFSSRSNFVMRLWFVGGATKPQQCLMHWGVEGGHQFHESFGVQGLVYGFFAAEKFAGVEQQIVLGLIVAGKN
jgi:hypothetical protein